MKGKLWFYSVAIYRTLLMSCIVYAWLFSTYMVIIDDRTEFVDKALFLLILSIFAVFGIVMFSIDMKESYKKYKTLSSND